MKLGVLGCGVAVLFFPLPALAQTQEPCPAGKPVVVTRAVTPAFGKGPLWITTGAGPIVWEADAKPISLMLVRDLSVPGPAFISGKSRSTGKPVRFTKFGETLAVRQPRYQLDHLGRRPKLATDADMTKYSFDMVDGWFPEPGCYEMTGRIGREQTTVLLQLMTEPVKAKR